VGEGELHKLSVSSNGRHLASVSVGNTIALWDLFSGKRLQQTSGHEGEMLAVSFVRQDAEIATAARDKTIRFWDPSDGKEVRRLSADLQGAAAIAPDGKQIAVGEGLVKLKRLSDCEVIQRLYVDGGKTTSLLFSSDGKLLVSANKDARVRVWNCATGHEGATLNQTCWNILPGLLCPIAIAPGGKEVAAAYTGWKNTWKDTILPLTLYLWDVETGKEKRRISGQQTTPTCLAYSQDGRFLISGDGEGNVRLWEVSTGKLSRCLPKQRDPVTSLEVSPDGRLLACGTSTGKVRVVEMATAELRASLGDHNGPIHRLAFSKDGSRLASGSDDTTILVWDLSGIRRRGP
jgi:WD40 repeat protein